MSVMKDILIVEDDRDLACMLQDLFVDDMGLQVAVCYTFESAKAMVMSEKFSVVLLDIGLPGEGDGLVLAKKVKEVQGPDTHIIMMTAFGQVDAVKEALRIGAVDFFDKPFNLGKMRERVLQLVSLPSVKKAIKLDNICEGDEADLFPEILGKSHAINEMRRLMKRIAPYGVGVLIQGETGTGKELVANGIHKVSKRANAEFVPINCGAIPKDVMESELFGHEKGAFTDAHVRKVGLFEKADQGTVFLDEIAELPLALQAKLLRCLQSGTFYRVGGTELIQSDFRILAASNQNLKDLVNKNEFREDLYYRLCVLEIYTSPLREREQDAVLLMEYFLEHIADNEGQSTLVLTDEAKAFLCKYEWPGNVRELENLAWRLTLLEKKEKVDIRTIKKMLRVDEIAPQTFSPFPTQMVQRYDVALKQFEDCYYYNLREFTDGVAKDAAKLAGLSLRQVYKKWETLEKPEFQYRKT